MTQVVVRLPDEMTVALDDLVAGGAADSRSDALRQGLALLLDEHRRRVVGAAIVAGYERSPQTGDEVGWADAATRAMIADEPW